MRIWVHIQPSGIPVQTGEWVWFHSDELETMAYRVVGTSGDDRLLVEELDPRPGYRMALVRPVRLLQWSGR